MMKLLLPLILIFFVNTNALMRFTTEQIVNPYAQGWPEKKVVYEDSLNLFHASNVRVNKVGYNTDAPSKKAFVYNHNKTEKFYLINAKTGLEEYSSSLEDAKDINGNSVSSFSEGNLTSNYYFDASLVPKRKVAGYPKANNKTGTETIFVANFSSVETNGEYFIVCGDDTSSTFEIGPYVLNKLASLQSMFLGFQRCGGHSWSHLDCHTKDGSALGDKYTGSLRGGWHDCGDHIKVGQNEGFTAMMLSFIAVIGQDKVLDMFNSDYTDTLLTDGIPDHLREAEFGARYIMRLYNVSKEQGLLGSSNQMITGVGNGLKDHNFWDLPSIQDSESEENGGAPRKIHINPSSDIYGDFASALAFFASEWGQGYGKPFADSCLVAADKIYAMGKAISKSKWDFDGLYSGDGYFSDEMGLAAIALAYAHKKLGNTKQSKPYIDDLMYNTALGSHVQSDLDYTNTYMPAGWLAAKDRGGTFLSGKSLVDWQNVSEIALYAMLKLMVKDEATAKSYNHDRLTGASEKYDYKFFRDRASNLFAYIIDNGSDLVGLSVKGFGYQQIKPTIEYAPYNLPNPSYDWGWNRYMMGKALIPFIFGEYIKDNIVGQNEALKPYKNYMKYYEWGTDVTNYLCGMNPWDISMIIGAGEKFPHHIHNRTACAENANTGSPPYDFIPPYGSLAPWVAPDKQMLEDITEDGIAGQGYKLTETCVDFSMAVSLAMVTASGAIPADIDPPIISDINYIQIAPDEFYFSWNTNELANCELYWAETTNPSRDQLIGGTKEIPLVNPDDISGMKTFHELTINGLSKNKTYYFMIKATDRKGNISYAENEIKGTKLFYKFIIKDMLNAKIKNLLICPKDEHTAKVAWWTDVPSNSILDYWEFDDKTGTKKIITKDDNATITNFHTVTINNLKASTKYGFTAKSGIDSQDSSFTTDFAFARFTMTSARTNGSVPEIGIFLQNADYKYNQKYDGLTLRVYLNYPKGWFQNNPPSYQSHLEIADWGVKNQGTSGVYNATADFSVGGRVRDKLPYLTDEEGNSYILIDLPSSKETGTSVSLDPGGWMYLRIKLYDVNFDDPELTDAWSITSHNYPIVSDNMTLLNKAEINGGDKHSFKDEFYIGVFQNDPDGNERHLYGYTPTTDLDDPGFYQNYKMELSLSEPVQVPPTTNFTVESDDDIRILELKGNATSVGERIGFGNIDKLLINKTEVPLPQPNGGNLNFKYDYPLENGTNVVNVIAIDETNCAFNNLTLTINSKQVDATPAILTVLKKDMVTPTEDAEIDAEKLYIKVVDPDENKLAERQEEITAMMINGATSDTEYVTCKETENNNGEFVSIMPIPVTSTGYKGDGNINGASGDIAQAIYQDKNSVNDRQVVNVTLYSNDAGIRFADHNYIPLTKDQKKTFDIEKDSLFVRLVDFNNQSSNKLDIEIHSLTTGDVVNAIANKLDGTSKVQPYGYGPVNIEISDAPNLTDDILSVSLMDKLVTVYTDKNDPTDITRDTLALNASFKKIYISWSEELKDTVASLNDTTTVYTTDKEFSLHPLGIKDDGTIQKANIKWNFHEIENQPFQFYSRNKAKDTLMTITLTGESEGIGYIDGKYELDPSVPIHNSGMIKVIDPIDRIFVIKKSDLDDGLTLSDTSKMIKDTLDISLGLPTDVVLVGIDDDAGKIYDIGGFWTIEKSGKTLIIDSTYSGISPPTIDINDMRFLGNGNLKVIYSAKKGLILTLPVKITDPVDLITVYSSSFSSLSDSSQYKTKRYYGLSHLYINDTIYSGDTIKVDKKKFLANNYTSNWVKLTTLSNSTSNSTVIDSIFRVAVDWTVENITKNDVDISNFKDSLRIPTKINDLFRITAKRNSKVIFTFMVRIVDMIDFGFAPNPITIGMLKDGRGSLIFVSKLIISKLNAEIYDINGNLIHKYATWNLDNTTTNNSISGDFSMIKKTITGVNSYNFKTIPSAWNGTNLSGITVNSGVYTVILKAYDENDKIIRRKSNQFYVINKK